MKNRILALAVLLVFGMSGVSYAASAEVLSDSALDGVSAGDWVILKDTDGNESVEDVYTTNNTLDLLENSQKDIKAVSNANAVDSAIAVQANVARVTGDVPTENVAVNNANTATINNFRPASSSSTAIATSDTETHASASQETKSHGSTFALNAALDKSSAASSSSSKSVDYDYDETLNASAALASSGKEIGKVLTSSNVAATAVVDYDKVITNVELEAAAAASSASESAVLGIVKSETCESSKASSENNTKIVTSDTKTETRDSKGVNNHIILDATAQQSIQAISNLNAVGAGAAVQTNVASNMGVQGTISQSNTASVSSGF